MAHGGSPVSKVISNASDVGLHSVTLYYTPRFSGNYNHDAPAPAFLYGFHTERGTSARFRNATKTSNLHTVAVTLVSATLGILFASSPRTPSTAICHSTQ